MSELKPCPCGKIPKELVLSEGSTCKWAFVSGDCCGDWMIEFRTGYSRLDSKECMEFAVDAWNEAERENTRKEPEG